MFRLLLTIGMLLWNVDAFAQCAPDDGMEFLCGPQNAEDLVDLPGTPWLIASGMTSEGVAGHLYLVDPQARHYREWYPDGARAHPQPAEFPDCRTPPDPTDFSAHGLSLLPAGERSYRLYVTAHGAREAVEIFDVDARPAKPTLTWVGCVPIPAHNDINSVAALADGGFITTRISGSGPEAGGDIFAGEVSGFLYEWHPGGKVQRIPGTDMSGPNGIVVTEDQRTVFVALWGGKGVARFARQGDTLQRQITLHLPFRPDNLRWTAAGNILAVGHRMSADADCGQPLCFDAWEVAEIDPATMTYTIRATKAPSPGFTGATVALQADGGLWLGTFHGDRLVFLPD